MGLWVRQAARPAQDAVGGDDRPQRAAAGGATCDASVEARSWGCGWFDSSLDLRDGLAVIEHGGFEPPLVLDLLRLREARARSAAADGAASGAGPPCVA